MTNALFTVQTANEGKSMLPLDTISTYDIHEGNIGKLAILCHNLMSAALQTNPILLAIQIKECIKLLTGFQSKVATDANEEFDRLRNDNILDSSWTIGCLAKISLSTPLGTWTYPKAVEELRLKLKKAEKEAQEDKTATKTDGKYKDGALKFKITFVK